MATATPDHPLYAYRMSFPVSAGRDAHWTDTVVTEGHAAYCAEFGHGTWTEDGVDMGRCPRCGAVDTGVAAQGETHAVAPNTGRNVHCECGAEYSLMVNLISHINRETAPAYEVRPEIIPGARVRWYGTGRLSNRTSVATVTARDGATVTLMGDDSRNVYALPLTRIKGLA